MASRRHYSNVAPATELASNINNSVTSIEVASTTSYPTPPFTGVIEPGTADAEMVLVTAVPDGTHFTSTRGYNGTTAISHTTGDAFIHYVGAIDYDEANLHITDDTDLDAHPQYRLPPGTIVPYAGPTTPSALWLICDGSAVS